MPRRPSSGDRAGGLGSAAVIVHERAKKRSYANNRIGWLSRITARSYPGGRGYTPWGYGVRCAQVRRRIRPGHPVSGTRAGSKPEVPQRKYLPALPLSLARPGRADT